MGQQTEMADTGQTRKKRKGLNILQAAQLQDILSTQQVNLRVNSVSKDRRAAITDTPLFKEAALKNQTELF